MTAPEIPSLTPEISIDALEKHNRITSWYSPRDEKDIELFLNENTITLPPHPPVQLSNPIDWYADPLQQRNWCAQLHMFRSILYVLAKPWATVIGFSERICCISVA